MKRAVLVLRSMTVLVWTATLLSPLSGFSHSNAAALFSAYGVRIGELRVGVVLLDLDGSPDPSKLSDLHDVLEGEERKPYSVRTYYEEATDGGVLIDFEAMGPYVLGPVGCYHGAIAQAGQALSGVDPYQFDLMMYVTEETPQGGCQSQGGSYGGSYRRETNTIVLYGTHQPSLIVHELGHALGLEHASKYRCDRSGANCVVEEYGDPTDLMGNALMPKMYYSFNAPHKVAMGVVPADQIKSVRRSGTYTVIGSEFDRRGTQVLRIDASDGVFGPNAAILIEYRQPLPAFTKSMASEFVVTAWTGDITQPTYYLGSLDCRRTHCDSLTLNQGTQTITITAVYEGTGKGKVQVDLG